jgi:hypothetical protein
MVAKEPGYPFLKDVPDPSLRAWSEFPNSELYNFMKIYFGGKITVLAHKVLNDKEYIETPILLAHAQGKAEGIRMVIEDFFNAVRTEHKRRNDRAVATEAASRS